jgi:hypothetical protein
MVVCKVMFRSRLSIYITKGQLLLHAVRQRVVQEVPHIVIKWGSVEPVNDMCSKRIQHRVVACSVFVLCFHFSMNAGCQTERVFYLEIQQLCRKRWGQLHAQEVAQDILKQVKYLVLE